ncbi:phospholipase [Jeotgalibacillus haloalkalitolerans]|uniref:phospholipase n=1 Tax=Jeotgalibacillus haloalkalitolerans TaxID=3104292 RepID=UPI002ACC0DEA|nr:phospholipase [Jeotgalibacillus sp. HH7-29]
MRRRRRCRRIRFCVFPGYRWCGPGCSGPGDPINELDAACKAHDECYRDTGNWCVCDADLIQRLSPLQSLHTPEGRQAMIILHYMKMQRKFTCFFKNQSY